MTAKILRVREVISGRAVAAGLSNQWRLIQQDTPELASPFFSVEFMECVASVRSDVRVAILESDSEVVGFFPFQLGRLRMGAPLAGILSDYHGVVTRSGQWSASDLIRQCGLLSWRFDHALHSQESFREHASVTSSSPQIDLSGGYEQYRRENIAASCWIKQCERKLRKMERELGRVRFVPNETGNLMLRTLLSWKSEQYVATGVPDLSKAQWIVDVLAVIHRRQEPNFGGVLSVLYAGETPVAAHFGMRSSKVWHWWFPAYNSAYQAYSPGLILLWKITQHAADLGFQFVDLGRGQEPYKARVKNREVPLVEGVVELPSLVILARRKAREVKASIRCTESVHRPLLWAYKRSQPLANWLTRPKSR